MYVRYLYVGCACMYLNKPVWVSGSISFSKCSVVNVGCLLMLVGCSAFVVAILVSWLLGLGSWLLILGC